MAEAKPFASLSSGLLARKGHAKPAMRPQGFGGFGSMSPTTLEDLGWNDMGHERPEPPREADVIPFAPAVALAPEPVEPEVHRQQEAVEREFVPEAAVPVAPPLPGEPPLPNEPAVRGRAAPGSKGKAAFTLRLDPARHLRLRLAAATRHRSAQTIVLAALDAWLDQQDRAEGR